MATRERVADRGRRVARRLLLSLGQEIRQARLTAGLSQDEVALAAGMARSTVGRVELDELPGASLDVLARISVAVGLDLVLRTYPGGDPVRDAAHLRLLDRLHRRLPTGTQWHTEVPLPIPGDQRAWDAIVGFGGQETAIEAETKLSDVQALVRRIARKKRDGSVERVLLLLSDTAVNRSALLAARAGLRGVFPLDSREALKDLRAGIRPRADGIIVL